MGLAFTWPQGQFFSFYPLAYSSPMTVKIRTHTRFYFQVGHLIAKNYLFFPTIDYWSQMNLRFFHIIFYQSYLGSKQKFKIYHFWILFLRWKIHPKKNRMSNWRTYFIIIILISPTLPNFVSSVRNFDYGIMGLHIPWGNVSSNFPSGPNAW